MDASWQLENSGQQKMPDNLLKSLETLLPDLKEGENNDLFSDNFEIWKEEAERLIKAIQTNYPSNLDDIPPEIHDLVNYLESIVRWADGWNDANYITLSELTPQENAEMNRLVSLSKSPNGINYLENSTYKKYLNIVERELKLPRYSLESICDVESGWVLYKNWKNITWSNKWAQWLFQFMPDTADLYMKNSIVIQKSKKVFRSRDEFLKDPLATAWAAWVIMNTFMYDKKYDYDFQSALACYNWGPRNYEKKVGRRNLTVDDLPNLPSETRNYVKEVTKKVLDKNSLPFNDDGDIFADIKCMWNAENVVWSSMG